MYDSVPRITGWEEEPLEWDGKLEYTKCVKTMELLYPVGEYTVYDSNYAGYMLNKNEYYFLTRCPEPTEFMLDEVGEGNITVDPTEF